MNRTSHFSSLLLVVALLPIFFLTLYACERGNPDLSQLEYEIDGQNRIHGFLGGTHDYNVFDASPTAIVTTTTVDPGATVLYQWVVNGTMGDAVGVEPGGGTAELTVPAGRSTLRVTVRAQLGAVGQYEVDINPACSSAAECDDGDACTVGLCDTLTSDGGFNSARNFSTCDFSAIGDGLCQDGLCEGGFCGTDPIDCSGSHDCVTDGVCDVACDPAGTCDRCLGQNEAVPVGTACAVGFLGTTGNVCAANTRCLECLNSQNRGRCVNGPNDGLVCDPNANPSECPLGACLTNPANVYDNPQCDSSPDECLEPSYCAGAECQPRPLVADGTPCTGGTCQSGVCEISP